LAPAITDFISDENRVCCNNDLEQTLTLLHSEWSKEIEPSGQMDSNSYSSLATVQSYAPHSQEFHTPAGPKYV